MNAHVEDLEIQAGVCFWVILCEPHATGDLAGKFHSWMPFTYRQMFHSIMASLSSPSIAEHHLLTRMVVPP